MRAPFIILGCGDRDWGDMDAVLRELYQLKSEQVKLLVITGGAPGADTIIKLACDKLDIHCAVMSALWSTRRRGAGPQRNTAMAELVGWDRLDLVLAFHPDISKSKGTKDMVKQADKHDVNYRLVVR